MGTNAVTLTQKIHLLRGLLSSDTAGTGPFYVVIDTTSRCNLNCIACPFHSPYVRSKDPEIKELHPDLFRKLCKELKSINTRNLMFCGTGEPFLHPGLLDMIAFAKAEGFTTVIVTNGTLMGRDKIEALIKAQADVIRVSLWGTSAEQYQQTVSGSKPDVFGKIMDNMKLLSNLKAEKKSLFPVLRLFQILNRSNLQTIDDVVDLAAEKGAGELFFSVPWLPAEMSASPVLSEEERAFAQSSLLRIKKRLNKLSVRHNIQEALLRLRTGAEVWQKAPCYVAWHNTIIGTDGTVTSCCRHIDIKFGNINENTFSEIWNGTAIKAFRKKVMNREGLIHLSKNGSCDYCCYLKHNVLIHRYFKWFSPLIRHRTNSSDAEV